jgi:hypothetical protein
MYLLQRDMIANSARQSRGAAAKPTSPRLLPLVGSPGPVTPLELADGAGGYLTAGMKATDAASHVDNLIRKEARRRGEVSPALATPAAGR